MSDSKKIKDNLEKLYNFKLEEVTKTIKDIEKNFSNVHAKKINVDQDKLKKSKKEFPDKKETNSSYYNSNVDISSLINRIENISLTDIKPNPYQPRKYFDKNTIKELSENIKSHGLFTPILLKRYSSGYYIISGERRFRATQMLNQQSIQAIILPINDNQMQEIALLENIQRENLNALEEARALQNIIDRRNLKHEELAKIINKSRNYVTYSLSLLKLPMKIQNMVLNGELTVGHVKPLMALKNIELMVNIANKALNEKLNVRDVENITKGYKLHNMPKNRKKIETEEQYKDLENSLKESLHAKILIRKKTISIKFRDISHLNRILKRLKKIDY